MTITNYGLHQGSFMYLESGSAGSRFHIYVEDILFYHYTNINGYLIAALHSNCMLNKKKNKN